MVGIQDLSDAELLSLAGGATPPIPPDIATLSDEQLLGMSGRPAEEGFVERTAGALRERGGQLFEIIEAGRTQQQTSPESAFQIAGTEISAIGDIIGQGIVSAAQELPEDTKTFVKEGVNNLLNTRAGKLGVKALNASAEAYDEFAKENPRAARNLSALFSVGAAFLPLKAGQIAGRTATGEAIKGGVRKVTTKAPVVTSDDISLLAADAYKRAEDLGGTLTPEFTNKFIADVEALRPQTAIGREFAGDTPFTRAVERIQTAKDRSISLQAAQEIDESLGDLVDSALDVGRPTKQSRKILDVQTAFREGIEKAGPGMITGGREGFAALKEGRRLWSASRRLADVEQILARAELAQNPATAIKTGFRTLVSNPKRLRGFTKREVALMRKAAKSGIISDTFRAILGSRLLPIISTSTAGLGAGAVATITGVGARSAAERGAISRAARVSREISGRAVRETR